MRFTYFAAKNSLIVNSQTVFTTKLRTPKSSNHLKAKT